MALKLREFRPLVKNSLRGFATVELPNGLVIKDLSVHTSNGKSWASMPAKPILDQEGQHRRIEGKPQYVKILEWKSRELSDGFSDAVLAVVRAHTPSALD